MELRLTVTDNFMWILDANGPETHHNTYKWQVVWIWHLQIGDAKRRELSMQLRLTLAETILIHFRRPTSLGMCQQPSQSESISISASYKYSKAINCSTTTNAIGSVTVWLSQLSITGTIPKPICLRLLHYQQCLSWPYSRDGLDSRRTSAIACELSSPHRAQSHPEVHLPLYPLTRWRTSAGLSDIRNSHLVMPPMAVSIAIAYYTTWWSYLYCKWLGGCAMASGGQQLPFRTSHWYNRGTAIPDCVAAL